MFIIAVSKRNLQKYTQISLYMSAGAPIFSEKSSSLYRRHYIALCLPILLRSAPGTTNTLPKL